LALNPYAKAKPAGSDTARATAKQRGGKHGRQIVEDDHPTAA
jgi:hypothetical protein